MSTELKEVRQRIAGTRQIRQVTSALQMISSARLQQYRRDILQSNAYSKTLKDLMAQTIPAARELEHPLLNKPETGCPLLIVLGTDRGLCGGFNSELLRHIDVFAQSHSGLQLALVGKLLIRRARKHPYPVRLAIPQPRRNEVDATVKQLVDQVRDAFLSGTTNEVQLLYHHFRSPMEQVVTIEQILPLSTPTPPPSNAGETGWAAFEPSPEAVLDWLLPEWLHRSVHNACLNSLGSEAAARQMAMARAADNAATIIEEQSMLHRRLRQESITTEMLELSGGSLS